MTNDQVHNYKTRTSLDYHHVVHKLETTTAGQPLQDVIFITSSLHTLNGQ
jgi:hypothetical protein